MIPLYAHRASRTTWALPPSSGLRSGARIVDVRHQRMHGLRDVTTDPENPCEPSNVAIRHLGIPMDMGGCEPLDNFSKIGHAIISSLRGGLARVSAVVTG